MAVEEREYLSLYFRADSSMHVYKREGYDLLTFLGDLGGLFDIVFMVCMGITSLFASRMLMGALIEEVYRVQHYFKDETQLYESKRKNQLTTESVSISDNGEDNSPPKMHRKLGSQ